MILFDSPLFVYSNGGIYATQFLVSFIWCVYLAICLVTLISMLLPKIIPLSARFFRFLISKIKSKRSEK